MVHKIVKDFLKRAVKTDDGMYEVENFSFELDPQTDLIMFMQRQTSEFGEFCFSVKKASILMMWYLESDRNDASIGAKLAQYRNMNKKSPYYNSNYGYYMFDEGGIAHCIEKLALNKNSRHACILINRNSVMYSDDVDKLCTNAVMFRIRNNRLNMTVQMRSNHLINNMPLDVFTFSLFYSLVFNELKLNVYNDLQVGTYFHSTSSMHVHANQFSILPKMLNFRNRKYTGFNFSSQTWLYDMIKQLKQWSNK